ncbi:MAG: nickel ABC transporter permease subunit NikC [Deltaproteobacteria bacterium]|jgi:nickel transport system permease protein|nr:nickel ABC transporter permease subunit NikC [Deltaproteobacteria bacterium]
MTSTTPKLAEDVNPLEILEETSYIGDKDTGKTTRKVLLGLALGVLAVLVICAIFAPLIAPHDPLEINLLERFGPASSEHWLGTDHMGRDIASRLIWACRVSLIAVILTIVFVIITGFITGAVSGYAGGVVDTVIMRICELFMTFPTFILALFLIAVFGTGLTNVVIAIVLTHWAWYARIVRGMVLNLKHRDYILAAQVCGGSQFKIFLTHIAPQILTQICILGSLDLGHMLLHIAGLSFLGLGIQPPTPEWGVMIKDACQYIWNEPLQVVSPGVMILLTVLAFNIPGDILRDKLDPSLAEGGH